MTLRDLPTDQTSFWFPDDDPISDIMSPAFKSAERFDCMVGYFTSASFYEIAHGLASYINNSNEPLRLLISPYLNPSEVEMIQNFDAEQTKQFIHENIHAIFLGQKDNEVESALKTHTKECLAYLISKERLQIRVVFQKDGIFHPKAWIWYHSDDVVMLSGSANMTRNALFHNTEKLDLEYSWEDNPARVKALNDSVQKFERWFEEGPQDSRVFDLPVAISEGLLEKYLTEKPPTEDESTKAKAEDNEWAKLTQTHRRVGREKKRNNFAPPPWANWENGDFSHQGEAIEAWEKNDRTGILEMATGSGKTITALIASWKLWKEKGNLVIWIAVPTVPLVEQWIEECEKFGLEAIHMKKSSISEAERILYEHEDPSLRTISAFVSTTHLIQKDYFKDLLNDYEIPCLLIADEVHNFGTEGILKNLPEDITLRLGISATPYTQDDDERNENLTDYFGQVVYKFTLKEAIGKCLVPYDYFLHQIELSADEWDEYEIKSAEIRQKFWTRDKEDDDTLQQLYAQRRLILDEAVAKIVKFRAILGRTMKKGKIERTIIFTSDKGPGQIKSVHEVLNEQDIRFRQITQKETGIRNEVDEIKYGFTDGDYSVLTAKRVLDEGFNIPEIETAFLMSSTTKERQWIQRRGRVLRLSPHTNKEFASLHDFLVLPPKEDPVSEEGKKLIRRELTRCREFWKLSRNIHNSDAATQAIADAQARADAEI